MIYLVTALKATVESSLGSSQSKALHA